MVIPVMGMFGLPITSLFFISKIVFRIIRGLPIIAGTTFYIPTYCAAWSFASGHWFVWYGVPLLCIMLFIIHPTGNQAWMYSMYWLIPLIVAYSNNRHIYAQALGSTFIAHAVGSVIWLYTVPMTTEQWIQLIPIVALERCTYAAGIVVMYHIMQWIMVSRLTKHTTSICPHFIKD
jgi:hypothetical protein